MYIFFDIFNEHPELVEKISTEEDIFYTSYLNFFEEKLNHLKAEIEAEEGEMEGVFTVIHILEINKGPAAFFGYSENLKKRMASSFSKQDFEKFASDLQKRRQEFLS
ncbi:MAG TPA: hypothetical protein VK644_04100 [Chitinophagaceae bacterium]|nr:hypothetical protein [Chitinophagaceae bacterium]